ncbi:capsule assembly Wzi family protein [Hymenobacter arizonensis]|uniref:Capsule assembly protein Wzi n=1 Tax=Hymenobacter arizonensis TaxID=1227077 RepID=A0A1I5YC85_HYMAR|nr:capsule assembly Wzi family protein [Hymenobacter arizonensis]SFQ41806.1 Capsule assembly protein Wzi [Hymenobacter arizonensis]
MHKALLLISAIGLLAGPLAAQTAPTPPAEPATPTTPTQEEKSPWLIFDQPLDSLPPTRSKAARERPLREKTVRTSAKRQRSASGNRVEATQGANYVPLDQDTYRLIDRYAIKFGSDSLHDPHTSVRPYSRIGVAHLAERMLSPDSTQAYGNGSLSRADRFNAQYLLKDNWANSEYGAEANKSERPILSYFYRNQTDLYHVVTPDFTLRVNPVLLLQAGRDNKIDGLRYVNTRGVQLEGTIDQRLGFYTFLAENQMAVPQYVQDRIQRDQVVPHEGYWKYFKTVGGSQYDFFTARGGITYAATKHINLQLAHDRNFIGNGYRSLILSDYSAPYFFLKINTRIWKFNYQNLFSELTAERRNEDQVYPKKYMAMHHLSFDVTPNLNIGVFESTILGGSAGRGGFELQYLNPLIFYRAIEQNVGSPDNAILGLDFKWNILHTAQLYGQVVLDEFKLSEIRARNGWWANKQAAQLGAKYIDVAGLRNVDLQVEFNYIRPFMYQHEDIYTNYQHYQQPLAHPMGANVAEILGVLSYQPLPRLMLVGKAFYSHQGLDLNNADVNLQNFGGNVLKSYNTRVSEFGNRTAQGNKSRLLHADFTATYQPRLNLFVDAKLIGRNQTYTLTSDRNGNEVFASLALRWNIAQRLHEF